MTSWPWLLGSAELSSHGGHLVGGEQIPPAGASGGLDDLGQDRTIESGSVDTYGIRHLSCG